MGIRSAIKQILRRNGYTLVRLPDGEDVYDFDGLVSIHDHAFMTDPKFAKAYQRGVAAAGDYLWYWRVHIGLWAAETAVRINGDFVECGVNRGFLSSAIMEHLDWNSTGKTFYLLDTFAGLDERQISDETGTEQLRNKKHLDEGFYVTDLAAVERNFAEWENVRIIHGPVPDTLTQIESNTIAYLHLDMNAAEPEVAAFESLWERLSPGALVLLDDYAYSGYGRQKKAMDQAAAARSVAIVSLPTGQGLMIKS